MIKKLKFLVISILLGNFTFSQVPAIQWQKAFGGSYDDLAYAMQPTSDGGYILAGSNGYNNGDVTVNYGGIDAWIVKIINAGTIQWQKSLGGTKLDSAHDIKVTSDGGYIMAGSSYSNDGIVTGNHGSSDFWVVKLNNTGGVQWQKLLGGSSGDYAESIQQTTDGGYIVVGESLSNDGDVSGHHQASNINNPDYWIVKLSSTGSLQWQKSLGGIGYDSPSSVIQTFDGGYIVVGSSTSNDGNASGNHGSSDAWIVKLNSAGNVQWQKMLGGSNSDGLYSIFQTSDGKYILAGSSSSSNGDVYENHGGSDAWVVIMDSSGIIQGEKSFGGSGDDTAFIIRQTSDGNYILCGNSYSNDGEVSGNHGNADIWVLKLNSNTGDLLWQKSLGGTKYDSAKSIFQSTDGAYFLSGSTMSKDGDVTGNHGNYDMWLVKLNPDNLSTNEITAKNMVLVENPVKNTLNIHFKENILALQLFSTDGKLIRTSNNKNMQVSDLPKGNYLLTIKLENGKTVSEKIIKE
ncbi:T9SS type A sorting domain-containing protein [Epilithonimonas sp.]|uniref:T9SS type A sorting domain-containing protein n=1 Tax=Epilithonimonas sp. TaxID=2894511 RepID=UPI0035B0D0BF